jgi:hypothetical protein
MKKLLQLFSQPGVNRRGTVVVIWLGWALVMIGYQAYVVDRFNLQIYEWGVFAILFSFNLWAG